MLEGEIRILDILPYTNAGPQASIQCDLRVVALCERPVYDALSYRWGDPESKRCIQVDRTKTLVTANLYMALRRLRRKDETRTIWIDQLCINQDDKVEKAVQVRLMGDIYSNCTQCLIWMDEIADTIPLCDAESIVEMLSWIADRRLPVPACIDSVSAFQGPIQALKSISVDQHPWWERIWTIQEAILPPKKIIHWGPLELPWDTLTGCATIWFGNESDAPLNELTDLVELLCNANAEIIECIQAMERLFCNVRWIDSAKHEREEAITTTIKWRRRKATDLRDKVFGLLGLLPSDMELRRTAQCNYGTPVAEVYTAFTLDLIVEARGLLPLVLIETSASSGQRTDDLPTWVCDMGCERSDQAAIVYRLSGYETYDACAGQQLNWQGVEHELNASASPRLFSTLRLTGVLVDRIRMIGTNIPTLQNRVKISQTLQSWMHMARKYHETLHHGLLGRQFDEAFFRVLVSDRLRDEEQCVTRKPDRDDLSSVSDFVHTGHGLANDTRIWDQYVCNQTFFITQDGVMGLGNMGTKPEDEIWVFDGGKMPFIIRAREGKSHDDFDLVGCCYASGVMDGEVYADQPNVAETMRRVIRLH